VTTSAETALGGLYDLETSLYPRTVLGKGVAERVPFAREAQALGRGSTRQLETTIAHRQEPERMSHQRPKEPGKRAYGLLRVQGRSDTRITEHDTQAEPVVGQ